VTAQQSTRTKYIVRLSDAERARITALLQAGKARPRQLLKARILLKADESDAGAAWSDNQIAIALDTSIDTVSRARRTLVEAGLDAALTRRHSPNSARRRIFDGAAEAKLIALACSSPPEGRSRWTLQLLEEAVVERQIVDRASDNTISRTLKKIRSSLTFRSSGSSRPRPTQRS
jgi:poly-gamma-glutamate capsule biosynthesis protein CapA/YwtB (metallophosphatase superfamily)